MRPYEKHLALFPFSRYAIFLIFYIKDTTMSVAIKIKPSWILIANAEKALFYAVAAHPTEQVHAETFEPIETLYNPAGRLKVSELVTERRGKPGTTGTDGKYEDHHDAHEEELTKFAKKIAKVLEEGREKNEYEQLIICAGPHLHGLLNESVSKNVARLVKKDIQKDYAALPVKELNEHVSEIIKHLV